MLVACSHPVLLYILGNRLTMTLIDPVKEWLFDLLRSRERISSVTLRHLDEQWEEWGGEIAIFCISNCILCCQVALTFVNCFCPDPVIRGTNGKDKYFYPPAGGKKGALRTFVFAPCCPPYTEEVAHNLKPTVNGLCQCVPVQLRGARDVALWLRGTHPKQPRPSQQFWLTKGRSEPGGGGNGSANPCRALSQPVLNAFQIALQQGQVRGQQEAPSQQPSPRQVPLQQEQRAHAHAPQAQQHVQQAQQPPRQVPVQAHAQASEAQQQVHLQQEQQARQAQVPQVQQQVRDQDPQAQQQAQQAQARAQAQVQAALAATEHASQHLLRGLADLASAQRILANTRVT